MQVQTPVATLQLCTMISESKMFDFFSQFGTVEQLELNLERGCCFVTFKDSGSIDTILESQNVRYLEFEGCEMCIRKYVVVEKDKIFVRGIPSKTSKEDIFNYFKQFGKIAHVNLHLNKNGAQCFAFVRFGKQFPNNFC
jgi:RNA recognition motif-containing protein